MVTDNAGVTASDDVVITVTTGSGEIGAIALNTGSSLDPGTDGVANPGDPIHYTFAVENIRNVTLIDVTVSEPTISHID